VRPFLGWRLGSSPGAEPGDEAFQIRFYSIKSGLEAAEKSSALNADRQGAAEGKKAGRNDEGDPEVALSLVDK